MRLVVGLGNPGGEYKFTRHNIGFWAVDAYLSRQMKKASKRADDARYVSFEIDGRETCFVKPQTYMNLSGRSVIKFVHRLQIEPKEALIIHDDADLEPGRLQVKRGGSAGGHNGLQSLFDEWGERDFFRLRIGVGKDPEKELSEYVLEEVSEALLKEWAEKAADALEEVFRFGPRRAMNFVNPHASIEEEESNA